MPEPTPALAYAERLAARREAVRGLESRAALLANLRLGVFLLGLVVLYLTFTRQVPPWAPALPLVGFVALVLTHDRALKAQRRAERAAEHYEQGIARLEDRWAGHGQTGDAFASAEHPYAPDLDLFGKGSLFELLDTCRTDAGEQALADWLRAPAAPAEIRARQAALAELRERLDLREDLAVLGDEVREGIKPADLTRWGEAPAVTFPGWFRPAAWVLGVTGLGLVVAFFTPGVELGGWPYILVLVLDALLARAMGQRVDAVVGALDRARQVLSLLAELIGRVEREPFQAERLLAAQRALGAGGLRASERIAQLDKLVGLMDAYRNQFFAPFAFLLHWKAQWAISIEAWRRQCGPSLGGWVRALGELEALCALSAYHYEHPADPFPEIVEGAPRCEAEELGHPLLPAARCVRNDLRLGGERKLLLVSGSNMSGKSTYLRTVGINAVLAQAGAPVRAKRLALTPLQVGATLRVQDSLMAGASRFYAEITRLKQLLDLAQGPVPLLFLLDEVLAGTNSHDRLQGAEALIQALLARGAIGLVTTHDLALARVAEALAPAAYNAHFADQITEGKLDFDYRLREGVVQKSNAIALMRAVGLPL